MKSKIAILWLWAIGALVNIVSAQEAYDGKSFENYAIALKAGTYGIGFDISTALHPNTKFRLGFNYLGIDYTAGLEYKATGLSSGNKIPVNIDNAELRFPNVNILVDYFPKRSGIFHFTTGLYFGQSKISAYGKAPEAFLADDYVVQPNPDNSFSAHLKLGNVVKPYFGIGLGRTITKHRVGFKFELGILYQGPYTIETNNAQTELIKKEIDNIELPELLTRLWPMLTLSLSYRIK